MASLRSCSILRARAFVLTAKPIVNASGKAKPRKNWPGIKLNLTRWLRITRTQILAPKQATLRSLNLVL